MTKHKKTILIPPNIAFGDVFSIVGLAYYLLDYYEEVFIYIGTTHIVGYTVPDSTINGVRDYITHHFQNDPLFNDKIKLINHEEINSMITNGEHGEYHICNTLTGDWSGPNKIFLELENIDKEFYFNDENPITNKLDIPNEHKCKQNKHLPNRELVTNHVLYYELVGLNNAVRMDYFNYVRNIESELEFKKNIMERYNILDGKYNIVNDPENKIGELAPHIKNEYPIININYLAPNPCYLLSLLEGAESIHFIEGSNVNFFYHAQYKNLFKYDGEINFHIWLRNRNWPSDTMNLDYAWTMMNTPKLDNWKFIFEQNQI